MWGYRGLTQAVLLTELLNLGHWFILRRHNIAETLRKHIFKSGGAVRKVIFISGKEEMTLNHQGRPDFVPTRRAGPGKVESYGGSLSGRCGGCLRTWFANIVVSIPPSTLRALSAGLCGLYSDVYHAGH